MNASTCPRRKFSSVWSSVKTAWIARDQLSTITKHDSGRFAPPTPTVPKHPQSTCACSPGSTLSRRYASPRGAGRSVEEALLHHLQALRELPADLVVPPRVVLTQASFARVVRAVRKPRRPTKALRDLMAGKRVRGEP